MGLMVGRFGTRAALGTGGLAITAAGVFFALVHTALWQACVMMGLLGIGFGFTFAAIPGLITGAVPAWEIGSAMGFYQVVRSIGFSAGSPSSPRSWRATRSPDRRSRRRPALWVGAVASLVAAVVAVILAPGDVARPAGPESAEIRAIVRDDAELASAGLIDAEVEAEIRGA
jgi:MFS family permease